MSDPDSRLPFGPPLTAEEQKDLKDLARFRRGRRITFERGEFRFWNGNRLCGVWRPGILERDPRFAHKALRWLAASGPCPRKEDEEEQ